MSWRDKANAMVAAECLASYRAANILPNGRLRKRHVPYRVPELSEALIQALNANNEHEVKRLFLVADLGAWSLI